MSETLVVLHYPTVYSAPVGVWYWDKVKNCPASFYLPGNENAYSAVVGLLGSAPSEQLWDGFVYRLADRTPNADAFSADTINVSPRAYLKAVRGRSAPQE